MDKLVVTPLAMIENEERMARYSLSTIQDLINDDTYQQHVREHSNR